MTTGVKEDRVRRNVESTATVCSTIISNVLFFKILILNKDNQLLL